MLDPVLPIAMYLLLGYLFKVYFKDNSKELIEFIIYFSLPAIVFNKIYNLELSFEILKLIVLFNGIIFLNLIFAFIFAKFLKLERKLFATFVIVATFGNTSFIGFSYIDAFYGQDYVVYALIYDLFGSFLILVSLGMVIINWGNAQQVNFKAISKSILYFPPIVMFFITIFFKLFDVPVFVINTTETLGATLVPLAMIAIGMKLQIKNIFYKFKAVLTAMLLKMILIPLIVYLGFYYFIILMIHGVKLQ